jgi:zinc-ribbon domain
MAYGCELGNGHHLYLDYSGVQTIVTLSSSSAGQQQQSSRTLQTGEWVAPPEVFRTDTGAVVKLRTALGERFVHIHGSNFGESRVDLLNQPPALSGAQPLHLQRIDVPAAVPMRPMEPLKMGEMQMSLNPMFTNSMSKNRMSMQMGNMSLQMGSSAGVPGCRFCSQCGTSTRPSDRFCTSCGHQLT